MKDETRLALLEQSIGHINETMMRIERKVDNGFEKVDKAFEKIDKRIEKQDDKIDSNFKWLIGTIISLFILNNFIPALVQLASKIFH